VSSNPAHGEVYSIQHYTINLQVDNGVNHPNPEPEMLIHVLVDSSSNYQFVYELLLL